MGVLENVVIPNHAVSDPICFSSLKLEFVCLSQIPRRSFGFISGINLKRLSLQSDDGVWRHYARRIGYCWNAELVAQIWRFGDFENFNNNNGAKLHGGSFTNISQNYRDAHRFVETPLELPKTYINPSALVLLYLLLNTFSTVLSGFDLFSGQVQLSLNALASFNGIGGSLRSLRVQYSSLRLHFFKLSVENPSCIYSDHEEKNGQPNHVPIGIVKPFIGFLLVWIGLAMAFCSFCIIRIRTTQSSTGSKWGRWILSSSVPIIWHGQTSCLEFMSYLKCTASHRRRFGESSLLQPFKRFRKIRLALDKKLA